MKSKVSFLVTALHGLAFAVVLTIYVAWLVYPLEIQLLNLDAKVSLDAKSILSNFHVLMNYLTNPFQWVLNMPDFPSSPDGLYHFEAVKKLFHFAQVLYLVTLPIAIHFFVMLKRTKTKALFRPAFLALALVPVGIGFFAGIIGFSQFFVLFHQVLFPGDSTWLFHPSLDPVILILPEEYFLHCFILFFVFYEMIMLGTYVWSKNK